MEVVERFKYFLFILQKQKHEVEKGWRAQMEVQNTSQAMLKDLVLALVMKVRNFVAVFR